MFYFGYNHTDYNALLHQYAKALGTTVSSDGVLNFPNHYANGYYKAIPMPQGLQVMILNISFNHDFYINRMKSKDDFFVLRFDEIKVKNHITVKLGKEYFQSETNTLSSAVITSSKTEFGYILRKGTSIRGVNILISKDCLSHCLGLEFADSLIQKYLVLQAKHLNEEPFDTEYRKLLNEIMLEEEHDNPLKMVVIQNRIMLLLERFFSRLYKKMNKTIPNNTATKDEVKRLVTIESKLISDFTQSPPSISELAREARMSETKFKNKFKELYAASPHEYYQKNRMILARNLLVTGKYSVKEVGIKLNFKNLSNFSIAFKKEFGFLPSEISNV